MLPCSSIRPMPRAPRPRCETWNRLPAPWDCKSRSSTPAPAARSMRPSQRLSRERPDALFVGDDPFLTSRRVQLVHSGGAPRDPRDHMRAREYAEAGGLMSYGANVDGCVSSGRRLCRPHPQGREACGPAGRAGDQVRAGHQRLRPPRMLGLTVPPTLLARRRRGDRMRPARVHHAARRCGGGVAARGARAAAGDAGDRVPRQHDRLTR